MLLLIVIHTDRLLDIGAVDLENPAAFLGPAHGFGIGPIEAHQVGSLLTEQRQQPRSKIVY
ncbi:MAG: hypothetical protein HRU11_13390 [Parvularculaceae bacterium]|nr:hypothetical protein [Parvularculaceae bacterium]